jgi:hypothetical protein
MVLASDAATLDPLGQWSHCANAVALANIARVLPADDYFAIIGRLPTARMLHASAAYLPTIALAIALTIALAIFGDITIAIASGRNASASATDRLHDNSVILANTDRNLPAIDPLAVISRLLTRDANLLHGHAARLPANNACVRDVTNLRDLTNGLRHCPPREGDRH